MSVLEARGLAVAFAAARPVFTSASFVLEAGFYGLVGANGAGKTTLLRALAGLVPPTEGAILRRPRELVLAYCPQDVGDVSEDIRALDACVEAAELKGRLALHSLSRWPTLSPGERKRWQIGAALAREPDILLLDEPTNHLDADARTRLMSALGRFRGIGVVVSHDRALLDRLPRAILRVHAGRVTVHAGNYTSARMAWEQTRRAEIAAHSAAKQQVRAVEKRLDAATRTHASASQSTHASSRMKNARDHDAKDSMRKGRARFADARAGKTVGIVKDALDRARGDVPTIERDRTIGGKIFAAYERAPTPLLFHLDAGAVCAKGSDHVVLRDVRIDIARDDRVRLAGPNGAGKTTLLEALLAASPARRERVLVLPQELDADAISGLLARLGDCTDEERGRVLAVFSALGSDPERVLRRSAGLSPGEARKLAFAMGLGLHAWALVLDEPTNHLDLPTIEKLEQSLAEFPGCIVLVTHDDAFAEAVTKRSVNVGDFRHGDDVGV